MARGLGNSYGVRTENSPDRQVHSERFDQSIVDVEGVPTRRQYVSRYNAAGEYLSQGYTHHGPATRNEILQGTWTPKKEK